MAGARATGGSKESRETVGLSRRYWWFRWTIGWIFRILYGLRVYGAERVPEKGTLIVAANHTQYLDPFHTCVAVPRRVQWMAKKELFIFPFDKFLYFLGSFPIDRKKGGRAALKASMEVLEKGYALGIFPEGTHRQEGVSRDAKSGVVVLAARSDAKVLPVYISPAPGLRARLRGARMYACIGKPLTVDENLRGGKAYREAADGILREIYALPKEYGLEEPAGSEKL